MARVVKSLGRNQYQYVNGEINPVVYSDHEKQAVKNFFENKYYIPNNSEFCMFKHGDITIAVKDIILPHLITNHPENFTKKYFKNYAITFKLYVYNNNQISTRIDNEIPDFISDYFV